MPRRTFTGRAAAAVVAPALVSATAVGDAQRPAPSERIAVGVIGLGSRGFNLIDDLLAQADAQIVAVCDVDRRHYRDRPWGQGPMFGREGAREKIDAAYRTAAGGGVAVTDDFREICGREDLDAVVVATPDHWHALCTLAALRAGKDVYCEKPVTHLFAEGLAVCREVEARQAVFQTGSQQRSDRLFQRAVELVRNGHLGRLQRVEVGLPPGYDVPQGDATVTDPPQDLDYDRWCGPARRLPYTRARHHRWWRGHTAYGGGVLMDWIGHHNDIAHWAMDVDQGGPIEVEAVGWRFPKTDVYDTPEHYEIRCSYAGGVETSIANRHPLGTKFVGEEGWLFVTRGRSVASDPRWLAPDFDPGPVRITASPGHLRNFLDCTKSRAPCIAPAEAAHRSITPGHLGYVAHAVGRSLRWDPQEQRVVNDPEADRLLRALSYRAPWTLAG